MPSRRWMWVRPTPHIYSYNRELLPSLSATAATATAATATQEFSRSLRATSEAATERSESSRLVRAATVAPAPGTSLTGYTGFYGRQLALLKEKEAASRSSSSQVAASKAVSQSSSAQSSSARAVSMAAKTSSLKQQTTTVEAKQTSIRSEVEQRRVQFLRQQEQSVKEGRQSVSRAVRRAEYHAEASGKDPRHIGVPRDVGDDILKKVADICISPFEGREITAARAAAAQGRLKIDRMEKELESLTVSAMKYKSLYTKSAAQMAKEAMEAAEMEASACKKVRKTIVEESSRKVAAA